MSTSRRKLLPLPPELIQKIYLHSLSPNFPLASPALGAVLSAPYIYRLTFLHAFWNSTPLQNIGPSLRPFFFDQPGPHLRRLLLQLSRPLSVSGPTAKRIELQESVMRCRWCTFDNAKPWLEEILVAVIKDLLGTLGLLPSPDTPTRLDYFIAKSAVSDVTLRATSLNGSQLEIRSFSPFDSALSADYHGPECRGFITNIKIAPTTFLVLPPHFLTGKPEWTREKVDSLRLFSSYVSLDVVKRQREAFQEGMRNAIIQRHDDALLTLVWLGTRLAEVKGSYDDNPFKPPPELFRLVAKQGMRPFAVNNEEAETSLWLFTLLLRAHAESMPLSDPDIEAWAIYLATCQDNDSTVQALGQWILDWGSSDGKWKLGDIRRPLFREARVGKWKLGYLRQPIFREGRVSRLERDGEMGIRFEEILGGEIVIFKEQLEKENAVRRCVEVGEWGRADIGGVAVMDQK